MRELDPNAQHGQQKDDGNRRGLRTIDCKQSRLMALQNHVTLSPVLISILSGTKIIRGEVLFPPLAATILALFHSSAHRLD
jgi:hypothetical protein